MVLAPIVVLTLLSVLVLFAVLAQVAVQLLIAVANTAIFSSIVSCAASSHNIFLLSIKSK